MMKPIRIISFDIGIKNMAFCILERSNETNDIIITDWQVIDLSINSLNDSKNENENENEKSKCNCKNKNNKLCDNISKYYKGNDFFCEKHANIGCYIKPDKNHERKSLSRQKIIELNILGKKYKVFKEDEKEKKSVIIDKLESFFQEKSLLAIKKKIVIKSNEIDLITIGRNMKRILDTIKNLDTLTHIIIENQISPIANRMKTIQGMLAQYFIMKLDSNVTISFISSQNKLKLFKNESFLLDKDDDKKNKYDTNKKDAIFYTMELLKNNIKFNNWSYLFLNKKKDDLSDCFLQGIWYMHYLKFIIILSNYNIVIKE